MKFRASHSLAILLPLAAILQFTSAGRMSPTVDETHYVGVGRRLWETGDWSMKGAILHPPLSYYLNSIPLAGLDVPEEVWRAPHQDERGRKLFALEPAGRVVRLARVPTILLTTLLLLLVFLEARRLFGGRAGAVALALAALEPNLLAHGSLATQDLLLALAFFLAVLLFRRWRERGGGGRLLLAGAAFGAALLSKYTALLLAGALPAAAFLDRVPWRRIVPATLLLLAVGVAVLHAGYLPLYLRGPAGAPRTGLFLLPAPYAAGIEYQKSANTGYPSYFLGRVSDRGWRAYYPLALLVKTPVPLLLLAAAGALRLLRRRERAHAAWLVLPPLLFALFFIAASRINIGLRYLLPVYPFLAVLGGAAAAPPLGRRKGAVLLLLLLWLAAGTVAAWPHYISYFNEFAGGSRGGARILSDSNLDWGQDLPGLARFLREKGDPVVYLAYFGTAEPHRYGIRYRWLPGWLYHPPRKILDRGVSLRPDPDWVAISRMTLHGVRLPDPEMFRWLEEYPVVAEIGGSIVVYDLRGDGEAHLRLADIYRRAGRRDYMEDEIRRSGPPAGRRGRRAR